MTLDEPVAKVIALQNAIQPYKIVAEVAVAVAHHAMRGPIVPEEWLSVETGLTVQPGIESAVHCDADLKAQFVIAETTGAIEGMGSFVAHQHADLELLGPEFARKRRDPPGITRRPQEFQCTVRAGSRYQTAEPAEGDT
jgi:hypothetical protein